MLLMMSPISEAKKEEEKKDDDTKIMLQEKKNHWDAKRKLKFVVYEKKRFLLFKVGGMWGGGFRDHMISLN